MAKSASMTFQSVAKLCNDMVSSGNKPSVRKLHYQLGGSFSTITEHLQQWRMQQSLAHSMDQELSDELKQALLAEFARITAGIKEKSNVMLTEKEEHLTETRDLLVEYEGKLVVLEKSLKECKDQSQSQQLALEKKLAASEGDAHSAKHREKMLQDKIDVLIEKCHQAELRAAIAETKSTEYNKHESRGGERKKK